MPFRRGHLLYFVTVADEGQFTRAAEKLHIAQPALSQAVSQLEADLGIKLLERQPRGVTLTPLGEEFYGKARLAVAADAEAAETARSLARRHQGAITFGYVGLPPAVTNPDLIEAFSAIRHDCALRLRELPFPTLPTGSWLREVDVAVCTRPSPDPDVSSQPVSAEPRVVLLPKDHPLATKHELAVAEVLDQTFLGFDPSVDPTWAGFWSLDDQRGGPPQHVVGQATNAQQRFMLVAEGRGIATAPACHAAAIADVLPSVAVIPLRDADPAVLTLVARTDRQSPEIEELFATARELNAGSQRPVRSLHAVASSRGPR